MISCQDFSFLRMGNTGLVCGSNSASSSPRNNLHHDQLRPESKMHLSQLLCYNEYTELESMRLSLEVPGLLLAGDRDHILDMVKQAARILSIPTTHVNTTEDAMSSYRSSGQNLVILDMKSSSNFDPHSIARSIRQCNGGEHTVIVGILKQSYLEKEELSVISHLNAGIDKLLPDINSRAYWSNEIVQLVHGPVKSASRLRAAHGLFSALDNCTDIVQITDNNHKVVWCNHTAEKILGYSRDDMIGKDIRDYQTTGNGDNINKGEKVIDDWINNKLQSGKTWEGPINCTRKTGDFVPLNSRVIPISNKSNRMTDQIIYVKDPPPLLREKFLSDTSAFDHLSSRLNSIRNTSIDVTSIISEVNGGSVIKRPLSGGKHYSLSIEAPITKVINIILAAQENQPSYIVQALDKVVEILRMSGNADFFSPEMDTVKYKDSDPGLDLLGALLASSGKKLAALSAQRRPSSERPRGSLKCDTNLEAAPYEIRELLGESHHWDFNIIKLEQLTEKRPLVWLGMTTLLRFEMTKTLKIDESILQNWLTLIEANYHTENSYHNSSHAADVLQATAYFLEKETVSDYLDNLDAIICLIGAIIHDVDHPGRNSAYLCNSGSELAILYNDTTVLENHHCALGFKLTHSDTRVDILSKLEPEVYKTVRAGLIDVVLATDMSKHFLHVNKFCSQHKMSSEASTTSGGNNGDMGSIDTAVIKRMLIKCADVSNPARPLSLCTVWAERIAEEYFAQTEDEKSKGLPVVMPQFDRTTCSIPKSQIGFYDFFIHDMFDAWSNFVNCPELLKNISENYKYWTEQLEVENAAKSDNEENEKKTESSNSSNN